MCLAIPGQIKKIEGYKATVKYPGEERFALVGDEKVKKGDYVMVQMGIVVKINRGNLLSPYVMILFGHDGKRLRSPHIRDLSDFSSEGERENWKINCSLDPQSFNIKPVNFLLGKF